MKTSVVKAKSPMDRRLREIMRMEIWECGPEAIRYVANVIRSDEKITLFGKGGIAIEVDKYSTRDKLAACEMILSRTYPTLQAIKVVGDMSSERPSSSPQVDWQAMHREALEVLREERGESTNGNGAVH